jgi:purine-cytosine permease-like protein
MDGFLLLVGLLTATLGLIAIWDYYQSRRNNKLK